MTYRLLFGKACEPQLTAPIKMSGAVVFQMIVLCSAIFVMGFASTPLLEHSKLTLLNIQKTATQKVAYQSALVTIEQGRLVPLLSLPTHTKAGEN
jgi:NADH:ubiquinone oxidoreductase subunit 4 (subunit M)